MLIEKLNKKRIPESHNKIKKSGTTFGYNFSVFFFSLCVLCGKVIILGVEKGFIFFPQISTNRFLPYSRLHR